MSTPVFTPPTPSYRSPWRLLLVSLALVLIGGAAAALAQSDNGQVSVKDLRFTGADGVTLSALLYVPDGVTAKSKAPAILAVHGYINSRETQDAFAIDFARHGYVVLDLDQSGHGFSGGAAFANGYGGPAALSYLRSLDIVDTDNIGLEGHSMGGWTVVSAAAADPNGYKSMVLEGSSTGGGVAPEGSPTFPKNLKLVYGQHEEFSQLMWNAARAGDVQSQPKMEQVFGTDQPVVTGKLYGSISAGTARIIQRPWSTHPGLTIDPVAVGDAVDWFDQTLVGGHPATGQIWWIKELGTLVAALGGIIFTFAFGGVLLRGRRFRRLIATPAPGVGMRMGWPWWGTTLSVAVISAVTYFPFQVWGNKWLPASRAFPQTVTTGVMFWAVGNALISIVLFLIWHLSSRGRGNLAAYGLAAPGGRTWRHIGSSVLLAVTVCAGVYALLAFSYWAFLSDFRFWVFNLHLMDMARFRIFLTYLLPFTLYALVAAVVLHGQLRPAQDRRGSGRRVLLSGLVLALGVFVLTVVNYIPLLAGSTLWISSQPLLSIVAFQFIPFLFIIGAVCTYFADRTGTVYTGAFISGILISWLNVAGTANQVAVSGWGGAAFDIRVWVPVGIGVIFVLLTLRRRRSSRASASGPVDGPMGSTGSSQFAGEPDRSAREFDLTRSR